jgi:hypothetical protein
MTPVLDTIRALLKFKNFTTISEIASMAGIPRKKVLEVINQNDEFVWRNRKNGRITRVDPRTTLSEQLWKSGGFYREGTFGAWSVEGRCLNFEGNADLRAHLKERRTVGALGDNWPVEVVLDTVENRAVIEGAGLRPWSEAVIDDRLWVEDAS